MPAQFSLPDLGPFEVEALSRRIRALTEEMSAEQLRRRGAAGSAFEELQTAQAAPPPELGAMEAALPQLFGDVASVISRRPEFGERTREDIKQRQAMLLQQRMQNIQVLRDKYVALAEQAEKLDPIKALEHSEKVERYNKLLEQLHDREMTGFKATKAGELAQLAARTDIRVAEINREADFARLTASTRTAASKEDYDTERQKIFQTFMEKGQVKKGSRNLLKVALFNLKHQKDT